MTDVARHDPNAGQSLTPAVAELVTRLPAYGRLYWRLLRQGGLNRG